MPKSYSAVTSGRTILSAIRPDDDVSCSHAASIGFLAERTLFHHVYPNALRVPIQNPVAEAAKAFGMHAALFTGLAETLGAFGYKVSAIG